MAETIRCRVDVDDAVADLLKAVRRLSKDLKPYIRDAAGKIADEEIAHMDSAAQSAGKAAALAARSLRVRRGEAPAIAAGGRVPVRSGERGGNVTGSDVFFGTEFGGGARITTRQFPPHRGKEGYWFWPTLREDTPDIMDQFAEAFDELTNRVWVNYDVGAGFVRGGA